MLVYAILSILLSRLSSVTYWNHSESVALQSFALQASVKIQFIFWSEIDQKNV